MNKGKVPTYLEYMVQADGGPKPKYVNEYERLDIDPQPQFVGRGNPPPAQNVRQPPRVVSSRRNQQAPQRPAHYPPLDPGHYTGHVGNQEASDIDYSDYPEEYSEEEQTQHKVQAPYVGSQTEAAWTHGLNGQNGQEHAYAEGKKSEYILMVADKSRVVDEDELKSFLYSLLVEKNVPKDKIQVFKKVEFNVGILLDE